MKFKFGQSMRELLNREELHQLKVCLHFFGIDRAVKLLVVEKKSVLCACVGLDIFGFESSIESRIAPSPFHPPSQISELVLIIKGCCRCLTGAVLSILLILGVEVVDGVRHDVARVHGLLKVKENRWYHVREALVFCIRQTWPISRDRITSDKRPSPLP